jgi:hypothetical protein
VKIYADRPSVEFRQFVTDLLVVGWIAFWIYAAYTVYNTVMKLAVPGQKMQGAGEGMVGGFTSAGDKVDNIPAVGGALAEPFDQAAAAGQALADAGIAQQEGVQNLAIALAALLVLVPLALVLFAWLPMRVRWIRRASYANTLSRSQNGRDLLALRAIARQPLRKLAKLDGDAADAWRAGDPAIVDKLAALELRSLGLRARKPR